MGGSSGSSNGRAFSLAQISEHNSCSDCWIVIDGKVYDVTSFLEDHPGGPDVIVASTGKDSSDDFEKVGHSNSARAMLKEYFIGKADCSSFPAKPSSSQAPNPQPSSSTDAYAKLLRFLVPLLISCLVLVLRFYFKNEATKSQKQQ